MKFTSSTIFRTVCTHLTLYIVQLLLLLLLIIILLHAKLGKTKSNELITYNFRCVISTAVHEHTDAKISVVLRWGSRYAIIISFIIKLSLEIIKKEAWHVWKLGSCKETTPVEGHLLLCHHQSMLNPKFMTRIILYYLVFAARFDIKPFMT